VEAPDSASRGVLAVIDWTVIVAVPVMALDAWIEPPAGGLVRTAAFGVILCGALALGILGRFCRAAWRGAAYPVVILVCAVGALWANGPFAGTGVGFAFAAMLAAVFLSRTALIAFLLLGTVALGIRAAFAVGVIGPAETYVQALTSARPWIRVGMITLVLLVFATLVLQALMTALERAYSQTADAYRSETATRDQLARARQELDEIEQVELVGRLAGGVAHDINNALTAILAASDVLVDKVAGDDQRRSLAGLESATHQAAELVRDLLWIGRRLPPTTEVARLDDTVRACRARLERMSRRVVLEVELPPSLHVALAPARLEQLLFWLIIRAHRQGVTELALSGRRDGSDIAIELRGLRGGGSPSASQNMRPKAVRSSLGNSATREVIEQAGGTLTLNEEAALLHVEIRLPAADVAPRLVQPRTPGVRTALVVEDEPLVLDRLAKLVARRGYQVLTASSLAEARPLLALDPDLLVTDLQLGDGRGDDLAISSFQEHPERPIVICSGFGASDALIEALRGGVVAFLPKPFTRGELDAAIPEVLGVVA